jgi:hypothetical protein
MIALIRSHYDEKPQITVYNTYERIFKNIVVYHSADDKKESLKKRFVLPPMIFLHGK